MPSSVKDRLSNTYEPILVFSKNKENIYKNSDENVVKIPLQQTRWKHTAVYPELLVEKMLNRVNLKNGIYHICSNIYRLCLRKKRHPG